MRDRPAIPALEILRIAVGPGCDGDSISLTATQPTLEDLLRGTLPGLPEVTPRPPVRSFHVSQAGRGR
jgi:hydrogenase small subunit